MFRRLSIYAKLAMALIFSGAVLLLLSYFSGSVILVFAGLGLVLWGTLFIIARPKPSINIEVFNLMFKAGIENIRNSVEIEKIKKIVYFPPYPKTTILPRFLEDFRNGLVFFSYVDSEDKIKEMVFQQSLEGVRKVPFGAHFVGFFEQKLRIDFSEVDIEYFKDVMPKLVPEEINFVQEFSAEVIDERIRIRLADLVFDKAYSSETATILQAVSPVSSAIGLTLSKVLRAPIVMETATYDSATGISDIVFRKIL
jgi:hypothetical protein